jgi:hypothetical protein
MPEIDSSERAGQQHLVARHRAITRRLLASIYDTKSELMALLRDQDLDLPEELPEDPNLVPLGLPAYILDSLVTTEECLLHFTGGMICDLPESYAKVREELFPQIVQLRQNDQRIAAASEK